MVTEASPRSFTQVSSEAFLTFMNYYLSTFIALNLICAMLGIANSLAGLLQPEVTFADNSTILLQKFGGFMILLNLLHAGVAYLAIVGIVLEEALLLRRAGGRATVLRGAGGKATVLRRAGSRAA